MANDMTVQDIVSTMDEDQKKVLYFLVGQAMNEAEGAVEEMKHNLFDSMSEDEGTYLSHDDMAEIIADGKRGGSLKESFIAHGITNTDMLFPDAQTITDTPEFIRREDEWVSNVMSNTKHTPFARVKSIFANLTEDEARAKGYIKGKQKKDQVFPVLKRATLPTTIYKKQKIDRDDVIDITDFDVIAWIKKEMRLMLDEEIARAVLIGDGRTPGTDDKIDEQNIRPIWKDDDLFTIKGIAEIAADATEDEVSKAIIRTAIKSRKNYRGTGNPTFYCTEDTLNDMLLMEDGIGRVIYDTTDKLANALRVSKIVTVPVMEGMTRTDSQTGKTYTLRGLIVNLADYNIGSDKGGAVNMFDDFDIDFNAQKYLIETRCSGAMVKPYGAISIETVVKSEGT